MVVYILQIYYCTNFSLAANRPCSKQSHLKVDPGESEYDNIHLIITKCCSWKKQDPTLHTRSLESIVVVSPQHKAGQVAGIWDESHLSAATLPTKLLLPWSLNVAAGACLLGYLLPCITRKQVYHGWQHSPVIRRRPTTHTSGQNVPGPSHSPRILPSSGN
ncbi:unnamed protein product, partial [Heterosigma akashiwo]